MPTPILPGIRCGSVLHISPAATMPRGSRVCQSTHTPDDPHIPSTRHPHRIREEMPGFPHPRGVIHIAYPLIHTSPRWCALLTRAVPEMHAWFRGDEGC